MPPSRVAAHGEEPQPLVQTGFQPVEAQRRVARRGQLDRQRHPVQCLAQRTDSAGVGHRLAGGLVDACREQLDRVGHREPGHREQALVRQEQPGAGRRQHRDLGTRGHDLLDAVANAVEQMLAVVQHEDSVAASQRCDQRGVRRRRPLLGRAHDLRHGTDDRRRIRQPHEVDEPGAVAPHRGEIRGDADRETALADPAGTDRRDEAVLGERPRQRGALGSPADERGHRHRQHAACRLLRCDLPRQRAPVGQLRLAEQCRHVRFDGAHRDEQLGGDLGVRQVPADQREDLRLARRHRGPDRIHGVQCAPR